MRTEEALKSCCDRARQERDYTAYLQAESELADLYLKAGRFEEAFLAAEDVLMLMEELNLEETESFGAALVQAAVACRESGRSREALKDFTRALQLFESLCKPQDGRLAFLQHQIGQLLEQLGEGDKAAAFWENALKLLGKRPDEQARAAQIKTDLALLALKEQQPQKAQELFREAAAGFESCSRQEDVRYSAALAGLGEALFSQGRLEKALEAYERALAVIEEQFGKNESYSILCRNCAAICRRLGEDGRAGRFEKAALDGLGEKD